MTAADDEFGPRRHYRSMLVLPNVSAQDLRIGRRLSDQSSVAIKKVLKDRGLAHQDQVYVTSVLKTTVLEKKKFKQGWVNNQKIALYLELLLTRPKYILVFGAPALKFFFKNAVTLKTSEGRWLDYSLDCRSPELVEDYKADWQQFLLREPSQDEQEEYARSHPNGPYSDLYEAKLMPCMSPAALEYEQKKEDLQRFYNNIYKFLEVADSDTEVKVVNQSGTTRYDEVNSTTQLKQLLPTERTASGLVGVDAEWQGAHPQNAGSYLRCIQLSWEPGHSIVLSHTDTSGNITFKDDNGRPGMHALQEAYQIIREWFARDRLRVAGFFYQADHEWLAYYGLDLMPWFEAAESPQAAKDSGGFAVELALAAIDELSKNNLELVRWRFTEVGDYFGPFKQYVASATKSSLVPAEVVKAGYGWIPSEVLYPYAAGDSDVTLQGALALSEHLDADDFGNNCWLPYWTAHRATPVAAEIMRVGMPFSLRRCAELAYSYDLRIQELYRDLRKSFDWPGLTVDSSQALTIAMYGRRYSEYRDKSGARLNKRPAGSKTLMLDPPIDNDDSHPTMWQEVRDAGLEDEHVPSTGEPAMGLLRNATDGVLARRRDSFGNIRSVRIPIPWQVNYLFYAKCLRQVQKLFCGKLVRKENGRVGFLKGYAASICDDGYVRALVSQVKETARWSMANPNLHNSPKRKEARYSEAMGEKYLAKVRSVFAAPSGYLIVESDYTSAELFMLAIASGDDRLWDHCQRSLLPKNDERYFDPHANLCVERFGLQCEPTAAGLKSIGMGHLREVAKCFDQDQYIHTEVGLVRVKKLARLEPGQKTTEPRCESVQSLSGLTSLVAVSHEGTQDILEVETSIGSTLRTNAEHRHFVVRWDGSIQLLEASKIRVGDALLSTPEACSLVCIPEFNSEMEDSIRGFGDAAYLEETRLSSSMVFVCFYLRALLEKVEVDEKLSLVHVPVTGRDENRQDFVFSQFEELVPDGLVSWEYRGAKPWLSIRSKAMVSLVSSLLGRGDGLVPDILLMSPPGLRLSFACGVLFALLHGGGRGSSLILGEEDAKQFQLLLQTIECYVNIRNIRKDGKREICAYNKNAVNLFEAVGTGNIEKFLDDGKLPLDYPETYTRLYEWANREIRKTDYYYHFPDTMPLQSVPTQELLRIYQALEEYSQTSSMALDRWQLTQVQRVLSCVEARLRVLPVVAVRSCGQAPVYDIQTTEQQQRIVIANGFLSHNSVIYGWCYGRGAPAIKQGVKQEGIEVALEQVRALIAAIETLYSKSYRYLEEAAGRVDHGFLTTPMGRYRRVPQTTDSRVLAGYRREFKNAAIQGGVADVVNMAAANVRYERQRRGLPFYIISQVHDALLFLVPISIVYELVNELIPLAMSRNIPIVPFRLDGTLDHRREPMYMSSGVTLYRRWGEELGSEELGRLGIDATKLKGLE